MSAISNPIPHSITLSSSGSYTSPLTITSAGAIDNGGTGDAVYGPATSPWTIANAGAIGASGTANSGINLLAGGYVENSGQISAGYDGIYIGGAVGTVVNAGTIQATGGARYDDAIDLGQSGFAGYIGNGATGLISANGGAGIYARGAASIVNAGTIRSQTDGIVLGYGGQIVNSGSAALITGSRYGIYAEKFAAATIINSGTISQSGTFFDAAILLYDGGIVSNGAPGDTTPLITGYGVGVRSFGTAATTISNFATISSQSTRPIQLSGGGLLVNGASDDTTALIAAAQYGYVEFDSAGAVSNFATIVGGVALDSSGTVANGAPGISTALIVTDTYGGAGVEIGKGGTVSNFGTIEATHGVGRGVRLDNGGSVYNATSGLIAGAFYGVGIYGSAGTVVNLGTISEGGAMGVHPAGIFEANNGVVLNGGASGPVAVISGYRYGVKIEYNSGAVSTITNFGTISATATNGYGVYVRSYGRSGTGSGTFVNEGAASLVSGVRYGVKLRGDGSTVTNFGTIVATASGGLSGAVVGYSVANSGSAALVSGYQNGVVLYPGGYLSNSGRIVATGTAGVGVYAGFSGGDTIIDSGTIAGTAHGLLLRAENYQHNRLVVEAGYSIVGGIYTYTPSGYNDLELSGALGPVTASLDTLGTANFSTVIFGPAGNETLTVSNASGTLPVTISGFARPTDMIDLTQIGSDGAISNTDTVHDRITVAGSLGTLTLQLDSSEGVDFATAPDGHGGTALTVEPVTPPDDFDGDGISDILWRNSDGNVAVWDLNGTSVVGSAIVGFADPAAWTIRGNGDFADNGTSDILWQDTSGNVALWEMNGGTVAAAGLVGFAGPTWSIAATGDFDGDGASDILWRDASGNVALWQIEGLSVASSQIFGFADPTAWTIEGTGDFNGDRKSDILWRDSSGDVAIWEMNGASIAASAIVGFADPSVWHIRGAGDFNGDGTSDILWQDTSGDVAIWEMNGVSVLANAVIGFADPSTWHIQGTGDYNGDGKSDILWRDSSGNVAVWEVNGFSVQASAVVGFADPASWTIAPPDNTGAITPAAPPGSAAPALAASVPPTIAPTPVHGPPL